jgi:uncharacterized protein YndB with AHSA1/START domain
MSGLSKRKARVVADVIQGNVLGTVEIAATPERVFRALSSNEITDWWGAPELYRTTAWSGEVRPGGKWRTEGVGADGVSFSVGGEYLEVDPPHKLVQTWKADWDGGNVTKITYRLEAIEGGTRLTLWHEGFAGRAESCANHGDGWERVLGWLGKHFAPELRYFLCRLLPPRPSFMQDMNAAELEVMKQHAAYWTQLLGRGAAVLFGPVADPKGGWGVGILRAADEEEVNAMRDADPAILSKRGFSYEILPMLRATTA